MKKLYFLIFPVVLTFINSPFSNAQVFNWATWTTGATSGSLSNGSCNMNVNVSGTLFQNTAPRYDDAGVTYSPTNGTGLALDHNWTNTSTATTVTLNFSATANNPSFDIYDINRQNPCAAFCSSAWTDQVTITTTPAAVINVTQAQPTEQTVTGNGTGTVTVVGNMVCNGVNGAVTINITGAVTSITITYTSSTTVDRTSAAAPNLCSQAGGETNCRNNRVNCPDPGRQYVTIGNINAPCCAVSVNDPADQTRCVGAATAAVTFSGSAGANFNWSNNNTAIGLGASGTGNIASFIPSASGVATVTVTPVNGCTGLPQTFTFTINPNHSITAAANRTLCQNTAISAINMTLGGGATNASVSGLPAGLLLSVSGNTATISGTPTVSGTFNYTVTTSGNPCTTASTSGTITVNPIHTLSAASNTTVCINTAITSINMTLGGGGTGANVSGLPTGITASVSGSTLTISGIPTVSGTFNYTATTTGNACTSASRTGTITVNPVHTISAASNRTVCQNAAMTNITMTLGGGATGANVSGLPTGVNASITGNTLTISGTPSVTGSFNYTVNTTGNVCTSASAFGVIDVLGTGGTRLAPTGPQCAGTLLNFTASPTGGNGIYSIAWTADRNNDGTADVNGSGNNFSFTAGNTGNSAIQNPVVLSVTSNGVTCTQTFNPTVNPIPTVNAPVDQALCNGQQSTAVNFSGNGVAGTVYNWTNSTTAIGLGASGTGNIAAFTAQAGTAVITVTPVANGCSGAPQTFTYTVNSCILPVELLFFNGRKESKQMHYLYWASASELNCAFYELEYSSDAAIFETIGTLPSKAPNGTSSNTLYYDVRYTPKNRPMHYYRLRQTDLDASVFYSDILAIEGEAEGTSLRIYPNPAWQSATLELPSELLGQNFDVVNVLGQQVLSGILQEERQLLELHLLTSGLYILRINGGEHSLAFTVK